MTNLKSRLRPLTDQEEAEIQRQIASDPDDADVSEGELEKVKPFSEALPELFASIKRARGRPVSQTPKQVVSIRLDQDVVSKFKATGKGWQARINEVLKNTKVG